MHYLVLFVVSGGGLAVSWCWSSCRIVVVSHRFLALRSTIGVHCSGFGIDTGCMLVLQIRTILLMCALLSCFPLAMASASTRSLSVRTSTKQMSLMFMREIAIVAPAVVLKDNIIVFAPSGSCICPVDIAPHDMRCVFRRRSCAHVWRSPGNQPWYVPDSRRDMSMSFLGSVPFFSPMAS